MIYMQVHKPFLSSEQKILQIIKKFGPNDAISEEEENNTVSSLYASPNGSAKQHKAFFSQVSAQISARLSASNDFESVTQKFTTNDNSSTKREMNQSSIEAAFLSALSSQHQS